MNFRKDITFMKALGTLLISCLIFSTPILGAVNVTLETCSGTYNRGPYSSAPSGEIDHLTGCPEYISFSATGVFDDGTYPVLLEVYDSAATYPNQLHLYAVNEDTDDLAVTNNTGYIQPADSINVQVEVNFVQSPDSYSIVGLPVGLFFNSGSGLLSGSVAPGGYLIQLSANLGLVTRSKWIHLRAIGNTPATTYPSASLHWDASLEPSSGVVVSASDYSTGGLHAGTANTGISMTTYEGMPVYDFTGSERFNFTRMSDIRTVFWVKANQTPAANDTAILGDSSTFHFHSNGATFWGSSASPLVQGGELHVDGEIVDGMVTVPPTEMSVISLVTAGDVQANNFAQDRGARYFVGQLGELVIFDTALSPEAVEAIEADLTAKWLSSLLVVQTEGGGVIDIPEASLVYGDIEIIVTPEFGKVFSHWEGALPISQNGNAYTFNIIEGSELVAHFVDFVGEADLKITNTTQYISDIEQVSLQIQTSYLPDSYSVANLPVGLSVDNSTGLVSGTLSVPGGYLIQLEATHAGSTVRKWIHLRAIGGASTITYPTATLHWDASLESSAGVVFSAPDYSTAGVHAGTANAGISMSSYDGMPVYDFTGSERFDFTRMNDIRTVFWVKANQTPAANDTAILGDSSTFHFHSNGATFWGSSASPLVKDGELHVDGEIVDGMVTVPPTEMSVISLVTAGDVQANNFAQDRGIRYFVGQLGELIVFDTALPSEAVEAIEADLTTKWLSSLLVAQTEGGGAINIPEASLVYGEIEITVTPELGKIFSHWEGAAPISQNGNIYTFNITEDSELIAQFVENLVTFEEEAVDTVLSNQYQAEGVLFNVISGDLKVTDVNPVQFVPISGDRVYGDPAASPVDDGIVELTFYASIPQNVGYTDFISFYVIDADGAAVTIDLYDAEGLLVHQDSILNGSGEQTLVSYDTAVLGINEIAKVVLNLGSGSQTAAIDHLSFNVPFSYDYYLGAAWISDNYDAIFQAMIIANQWDKVESDARWAFRENFLVSDPDKGDAWLDRLEAWYRPEELDEDYAALLDPEVLVGEWRDALGLHTLTQNNATDVSAGKVPKYEAALSHGKSGIYLDDTQDHLDGGYSHEADDQPLTISVVYALRALNGGQTSSVVYASGAQRLIMGSEASEGQYSAYANDWLSDSVNFEADRFVVHTYRYDPSDSDLNTHWVNGIEQGSRARSMQIGSINLGRDHAGDANAYVSEMIIYEKALNPDDREQVEVYLADKYELYHPKATWITDSSNGYDSDFQNLIISNHLNKTEADALHAFQLIGYSELFLDGLKAWYRPEELSADYEPSDSVSVWRDALGLHSLSTSDPDKEPIYLDSLSHDLGGLDFDNADDGLLGTYDHQHSTDSLTVVVVYAQKGIGTKRVVCSDSVNFLMAGRSDNGDRYSAYVNNAFLSNDVADHFEENRFVIHSYRYDGAGNLMEHRVDGRLLGTRNGAFLHREISLGSRTYSSNQPANAYVSELLIYEKALSTTTSGSELSELDQVEVYLADKYGLYHPKATWITDFDANSQAIIYANKLNRDQFVSDAVYGAYAVDAPWLDSYSTAQRDYITAQGLNLWEVPLPPGPLESTYGLEQGLIFYTPLSQLNLNGEVEDLSPSSLDVVGNLTIDQPNRFGQSDSAPNFAAQYLTIPAGFDLDPLQNVMTISLWTKPLSIGNGALVAGYDAPASSNEAFYFGLEGAGYRQHVYGDGGATSYGGFKATTAVAGSLPIQGQWHHLASRLDGVNLVVWQDLESGGLAPFSGPMYQDDKPVGIGAGNDGSRLYDGLINDVMAWNRALTDEELKLLYFIQIDPDATLAFEGMISGQTVAPIITSLSYDGTVLSAGDVISAGASWSVELGVAVNVSSVRFYLDDSYTGNFVRNGASDYTFDQGFDVTPGYHDVKVVVENIDGFSDELTLSLQFEGNVAPAVAPTIDNIFHETTELLGGETVFSSGYVSVEVSPNDDVSVSGVDYYLNYVDSNSLPFGTGTLSLDQYTAYMNLQGLAGQSFTLRAEAQNPFFSAAVIERNFNVSSARLVGDVYLEWEISTDVDNTADQIFYELDYSLHGNSGPWVPVFTKDDLIGDSDPQTEVIGFTWDTLDSIAESQVSMDIDPMEDSLDLYLRLRAHDGVNDSDNDIQGPYDFDDGPPTDLSIDILGDDTTVFLDVELALSAKGATEMLVSEGPDFTGATWQSYVETLPFALSNSLGSKTVRAIFRDIFGNEIEEADAVIDTIVVIAPTTHTFNTGNINIAADDLSYDGHDIIVDGAYTLTIEGQHIFNSLTLTGGAILTAPETTTAQEHRLDLSILVDMFVDSISRVDVSGKGYLAGYTYGLQPYSGASVGAVHAANGSDPAILEVYGDFRKPVTLGSGGNPNTTAEAGGGAINLWVGGRLELDGQILADGSSTGLDAGGAGGSILISADELDVSDTNSKISASGSSQVSAYSASGGRIAIYYNSLNMPTNVLIASSSPDSADKGGAGTIYLEETDADSPEVGALIVDNNGNDSSYSTPFDYVGSGTIVFAAGNELRLSSYPVSPSNWDRIVGLWIEPNSANHPGVYFRITGYEAYYTTVYVDTDLNSISEYDADYQGIMNLKAVTVRGNANVTYGDPLPTGVTPTVESGSTWTQLP